MTVVEIRIELKKGVADPEGKNTRKTLESLGFKGVNDVKTVKLFEVDMDLPPAEAQAEAEAIRDSIKAEMLDRDTEELQAGKYIVRWTPVLSNRFDSTSFKKQYGELYKAFVKQVSSRRFSISA